MPIDIDVPQPGSGLGPRDAAGFGGRMDAIARTSSQQPPKNDIKTALAWLGIIPLVWGTFAFIAFAPFAIIWALSSKVGKWPAYLELAIALIIVPIAFWAQYFRDVKNWRSIAGAQILFAVGAATYALLGNSELNLAIKAFVVGAAFFAVVNGFEKLRKNRDAADEKQTRPPGQAS
jgi:hypothetical protein